MLYKLKVALSKSPLLGRVQNRVNRMTNTPVVGDNRVELIQKYVSGKSFVDVGCMWGVDGFYAFTAEAAGATRTVGVDVYPESEEFLKQKQARNSKIEFVQGDINQQETVDKIGLCDVVFCSGVLYHTPNPIHMLGRLRLICDQILILDTSMIPENPDLKNMAVFYPYLSEEQRKLWDRNIGRQKGITGPYEPESGYANWFWGFTPSCLEGMLQCAGFKVEERFIEPFRGRWVCRTIPAQFLPVSGDWTTPKDADFLQFKR